MDAKKLRVCIDREKIDLYGGDTSIAMASELVRTIKIIIPPKDQSDRTNYLRLRDWVVMQLERRRRSPQELFPQIIDFALESSGPQSRNPAAVFMSLLKNELNYPK